MTRYTVNAFLNNTWLCVLIQNSTGTNNLFKVNHLNDQHTFSFLLILKGILVIKKVVFKGFKQSNSSIAINHFNSNQSVQQQSTISTAIKHSKQTGILKKKVFKLLYCLLK